MATSEADLKDQLGALDWGTMAQTAPVAVAEATVTTPPQGGSDPLDIDVGVAGVKPARPVKVKPARKPRSLPRATTPAQGVVRQPVAQALLDATVAGQTVEANKPVLSRRGRNTQPDVLTAAGESPAVIALFDAMWKDVGSKLARGIGRPKASRQDAAIGWYAMLLAMRERDAR